MINHLWKGGRRQLLDVDGWEALNLNQTAYDKYEMKTQVQD